MKTNIFINLPTILASILIISLISTSCNNGVAKKETQDMGNQFYRCPPCGCEMQGKVFHKSGLCPSCGMELEEVEAAETQHMIPSTIEPLETLEKKINVGIFIFDYNQVLDYAGPFDVFSSNSNFNVYTVGAKTGPIVTGNGLVVHPTYDITNAPSSDILIIPAGSLDGIDDNGWGWLKIGIEEADYVMSVCNGAFVLGELGLLDDLEATAHKGGIDHLERNYPNIKKINREKRFVDNGKIITSAGVSAGIDTSFYLISKILGNESAQATANAIEYLCWQPNKDNF